MPAREHPLRLVSHNVYWFQGAPFRGNEPVGCDEAVLEQLLGIYAELEPEILCLQEVHEPELAQHVAAALGMQVGHCPGGQERQYGGALLWRGEGQYHDWRDADATPFRIWQQLDLPEDAPAGPLRVMNVHLPSNRGRTAEQGEQQRIASLGQLLPRRPDVLMGDFNAQPDAAALRPLHEAGYLDVAEHLGLGDLGTAGSKRIDYAWVHHSLADRLCSYRVVGLLDEAHRPRVGNKDALSDHWPLCIELAAPTPNDTGASAVSATRQTP